MTWATSTIRPTRWSAASRRNGYRSGKGCAEKLFLRRDLHRTVCVLPGRNTTSDPIDARVSPEHGFCRTDCRIFAVLAVAVEDDLAARRRNLHQLFLREIEDE